MNTRKQPIINSLKNSSQLITTISLFALVVIFVLWAVPAFALETGLEYGTYIGLGTQDIRISIMKIVRIFLGLVGIIAIIIIIYAGYLWMTSAGNPEKIDKAKKTLRNAAIGLAIIFFAFAIVSFIIRMLEVAMGPPGPPGPPYPPGCENCGYLGGGIIESVYPPPLARDVARDTAIIVTFKEEITPNTIIQGAAATCTTVSPCSGDLKADNIKIYKEAEGEGAALGDTEVAATSKDMKTYEFYPDAPLGDSVNKHWYTVKLTAGITKESDGTTAFPGVRNYFSWGFEVGTKLDLIPPQLQNVFPIPDNQPDNYTAVPGSQATGSIIVGRQPNIDQATSATLVTQCNDGGDNDGDGKADSSDPQCADPFDITLEADPNTSIISFSGVYNAPYRGTLTLTVAPDFSKVTAIWGPPNPNGADEYSIDSVTQRVEFGNGIYIVFQESGGTYARGQTFFIELIPQTVADSLQIANKVYRFVDRAIPADNEIDITDIPGSTANLGSLAQNIANRIDGQTQSPNVLASRLGTTVNLTAELAGSAGNYINVATTGNWATITPMSGGSDQSTSASCVGACDQPRNATIRIDFNEAMLPTEAAGKVNTDNSNSIDGAGGLQSGDFTNITVQADLDNSDTFDSNEYVAGTFIQSNQYQTVEFISLRPCKDASGNPIVNSCGWPVFCLPVNPVRDYVKYRVIVKAANLRTCTGDPECTGLRYEDGTSTESCNPIPKDAITPGNPSPVCGNDAGIFYMKADIASREGVVDASNNSFDGNKNGYTQGNEGQSLTGPYSLNTRFGKICDNEAANPGVDCTASDTICSRDKSCRLAGDDLVWEFYIKNKVELKPPVVLEVSPAVGGTGASLISPVNSTFNKLLRSSTIKPGGGYIDGMCTCTTSDDCPARPDQVCLNGFCINQNNSQVFCGKNDQCSSGYECKTKKYITLYDISTRPVGWWVANFGEDIRLCLNEDYLYRQCTSPGDCGGGTCGFEDGWADRSIAQIRHTPFFESTNYSAELASGIEDIYQNCYMPGKGPEVQACDPWASPTGCCPVSSAAPYCCNGLPSVSPCLP